MAQGLEQNPKRSLPRILRLFPIRAPDGVHEVLRAQPSLVQVQLHSVVRLVLLRSDVACEREDLQRDTRGGRSPSISRRDP